MLALLTKNEFLELFDQYLTLKAVLKMLSKVLDKFISSC
jgi:hypothetical protein